MIKLLVTDVDGVLTDGKIYMGSGGEQVTFNVKDGLGAKILKSSGVTLAAISGRGSNYTEKRLRDVGFDYVYLNVKDKLSVLNNIQKETKLSWDQIAYVGDDLNDIECLKAAGVSFAPNDAASSVLKIVDHVTRLAGGYGCFREVCEYILSKEKINIDESFKGSN